MRQAAFMLLPLGKHGVQPSAELSGRVRASEKPAQKGSTDTFSQQAIKKKKTNKEQKSINATPTEGLTQASCPP